MIMAFSLNPLKFFLQNAPPGLGALFMIACAMMTSGCLNEEATSGFPPVATTMQAERIHLPEKCSDRVLTVGAEQSSRSMQSMDLDDGSSSSSANYPGESTWRSRYANGMNQCRSPYPGPITGRRAWTRLFLNPIVTWPVIADDGSVLVATDDHQLFSIAADGSQAWVFGTDEDIVEVIVGPDSRIYVLDAGSLSSLLPDGTVIWTVQFNVPYWINNLSGMTIVPGPQILVFFSGPGGHCGAYSYGIHVLDPAGFISYTLGTLPLSESPAWHVDNYMVYITWGRLMAMTSDGTYVWVRSDDYHFGAPITASTGVTYTACLHFHDQTEDYVIEATDGGGNALFLQSGFASLDSCGNHPAAAGRYGHLYFVAESSEDSQLSLFSMNPTGGIRWRVPLDSKLSGSTSIAIDVNETIFVSFKRGLLVFNGDGQPIWSSLWPSVGDARSCLAMDGTLYTARGTQLIAFRD